MSGAVVPFGQIDGVPELAPPEHPKAPELAWEGQKSPFALNMKAMPVVIGVRPTGNDGRAPPGAGLQS